MHITFKDCYASYTDDTLTIGNSVITRAIRFHGGSPFSLALTDVERAHTLRNAEGKMIALCDVDTLCPGERTLAINAYECDNDGRSTPFLRTEVQLSSESHALRIVFDITPLHPFITSRQFVKGTPLSPREEQTKDALTRFRNLETLPGEHGEAYVMAPDDTIDAIPLPMRHLRVHAYRFYDSTDHHNHLVREVYEVPYHFRAQTYEGNVFLFDAYAEGNEGVLVVKESATVDASLSRVYDDVLVQPGRNLLVRGSGIARENLAPDDYHPAYGVTFGVGDARTLIDEYRRYYRARWNGKASRDMYIMSNTWGDRNQDAVVSEAFVMKEIDAAREIGVDIVQIDDGWQKGITQNSARATGGVWEGYYAEDPRFWDVDTARFPGGLSALATYAKERGVRLGLWFSPDSSNDFAEWERDATTLLAIHREYGISHFKLDGIKIRSKRSEVALRNLFATVMRESGNVITFNLDVTAEVRFGYFYEQHVGTIFLENRYTDWGNYYPHATLKNLWLLSRFIPAQRLQVEFLNNARNADRYPEGDPFAPATYTPDYLFATTLVASPLAWMEVSSLSDDVRIALRPALMAYKKVREAIFNADIRPIGSMPDGTQYTGFHIRISDAEGFFLFFREVTKSEEGCYYVPVLAGATLTVTLVLSNRKQQEVSVLPAVRDDGCLSVRFQTERTYALYHYHVVGETEHDAGIE